MSECVGHRESPKYIEGNLCLSIHLSGNEKGRPQMSLAFNCRDLKKSKPKEIREKVERLRADTYHVEQTLRDTDSFLPRVLRQSEGHERPRDGAGRRQTREAPGGGSGPRGPESPKRLPGLVSLDTPAVCLSSPHNYE